MRVVIADDEPLARALLRTLLEERDGIEVVGEAADGEAAVAAVRATGPDLVFLDIDMPHRNGLHAAEAIANVDAQVIFVTAHEEHAIDAFELGAIDYVLKPVRRARLQRTLDRAVRRHAARAQRSPGGTASPSSDADDGFWVPVLRGLTRVAVADIVRVEAARDHVYFHTAERAYLYRITMAELEFRLEGSGLLRVHRSSFVRPERMLRVKRHGKSMTVDLDDGASVPVGSTYRQAVLATMRARG